MTYSSDRTITQLNSLAGASIDTTNDEVPIWDASATAGQRTTKVTVAGLLSRVDWTNAGAIKSSGSLTATIGGFQTAIEISPTGAGYDTTNHLVFSDIVNPSVNAPLRLSQIGLRNYEFTYNSSAACIFGFRNRGTGGITIALSGALAASSLSSSPSTPANGFSLFSNASNHFVWRNPNGFLTSFISTANTADRAYTLPNQSGTIALTGNASFQYTQSTVPSSPANGERWLELDGSGFPVEAWYFDSANTRWLSVNIYSSQTINAIVNATTNVLIPVATPGANVFLISIEQDIRTGTNHTGSLHYTLQPQFLDSTGTGTNIGTALNTQTLAANTWTSYSWTVNATYASPFFRVVMTRVSTPASVDVTTVFLFRRIRA